MSITHWHKAEHELVELPCSWADQETRGHTVGVLIFLVVSWQHQQVGECQHHPCSKNTAQKIVILTKISTIPSCLTWSGPPWLCGFKQGKSKPVDVSILCVELLHPGLEVHQEKATASSHKPRANSSMAAV